MPSSNNVANNSTVNLLPVQTQYDANGNSLGLFGQSGNLISIPVSATSVTVNNGVIIPVGNPTISFGFGTNPSIQSLNTFVFKIIVGTGGAAAGTINLPTAQNGWLGFAADVTSGSALFLQLTGSTSTSLTFTSYSVTTGAAANMLAGDIILVNAIAY